MAIRIHALLGLAFLVVASVGCKKGADGKNGAGRGQWSLTGPISTDTRLLW